MLIESAEQVEVYRGWAVTFDRYRPVTGLYRAERHGVGLCAGDLPALKRMVDVRVNETRGAA